MANAVLDFLVQGVDAMKNYLDYDSRGMGYKDSKTGIRYMNIPTPAWYPDSFIRSLKNSLYLKMINNAAYENKDMTAPAYKNPLCLKFYEETTGGNGVMNALKGALKQIVTVGVNQVSSVINQVQSAYDSVTSLFSSGDSGKKGVDLEHNADANLAIPFLASVPYIEVKGIHVTEGVKATIEILKSALKMADSAWSVVKNMCKLDFSAIGQSFANGNTAIIKAIAQTFFSADAIKTHASAKGKDAAETYPNDWSQLFELIFSNDMRLHGVSEQLIRQSLVGRYTMSCKIPYLATNKGDLIKSTGQEGFKGGANSYEKAVDNPKDGAKDKKTVIARSLTQDLNIGVSDMIKWMYNTKEESYTATPVDTTFTIYNDTFEHFMVNYAFIYGFMSTTKATTDGILVRAPYVYDVTIPGGVRYMMCSCEASVKCIGKMRRLSNDMNTIGGLLNDALGIPVNGNAIEFVPDAYEVHIKFKSLLPDLWNFIESYINMNTQSTKSVPMGTEISSTLATFAKNLTESNPEKSVSPVKEEKKAEADGGNGGGNAS